MRTLCNTSILVGIMASLLCGPAWAQAQPDPVAAANLAQDAAAEAAAMNGDSSAQQAADSAFVSPPATITQKSTTTTTNVYPNPVAHASAAASAPSTVQALQVPSDQRMKQMAYNEGDVYTITTKYGYQTNIVFSPKEDIETISVGDKSVWQIIPSGNRLFIRPMEEDVTTNMTVLTNKRSYQFDLKSLGPAQTEGNIYVASFVYPEEIIAAAQAAAAAEAARFAPQVPVDAFGNPIPMAQAQPYPSQPVMADAGIGGAPVTQDFSATYVPPAAPAPLPSSVPFGGPTPAPQKPVLPPKAPVAHASKHSAAHETPAPAEPEKTTTYTTTTTTTTYDTPASVPFGGPTPAPEGAIARSPAPVEMAAAPAVVVPPANANFNYTYTGSDELAPLQVYDDGQATYLKYSSLSQPLPDVYMLDASGSVVAVPHDVRGEYLVIQTIAPELIVKNDGGSVHVYNESLSPKP